MKFKNMPAMCMALLNAAAMPLVAQPLDLTRAYPLDSLPPGTPLRVYLVRAPSVRIAGTLQRFDSAQLIVSGTAPASPEFKWHIDDVDRIDMLGERSDGWAFGHGAGIGALFGLSIGVASTVYAVRHDQRHPCGDCYVGVAPIVAILTVPFTVVTTLTGGLIGLADRNKWRPVPIPVQLPPR